MTHDGTIAKWMENTQVRKAVFEFNAQYAVLDKILATRKKNCFGSIGHQEKAYFLNLPSEVLKIN